jgi:secondary thiamine-phosphate synthase enzyme
MKKITVKTRSRIEMLDVTAEVAVAVSETGVREGICVVYCPHTTSGVIINEHADPSVAEDINSALSEQYPHRRAWRHLEGNADAHTKAAVLGNSVTVIVSGGRLALGTWQGIFFCECDGPRNRELYIQTIGGK